MKKHDVMSVRNITSFDLCSQTKNLLKASIEKFELSAKEKNDLMSKIQKKETSETNFLKLIF